MTTKEFYKEFNTIVTKSGDVKGDLKLLLEKIKGTGVEKQVGDIDIDKIVSTLNERKGFKVVDVFEKQEDGYYEDEGDDDYDWGI